MRAVWRRLTPWYGMGHFCAGGVRWASSQSCGIVGLPNVGKSTFFNALTATQLAEAGNFPFCTIKPNVGRVSVPDPCLDTLARLTHSKRKIPSQIEFVDLAGLVQNASEGAGLGNQFLANIRSVSAVLHMVRCFEDEQIVHVEGTVDPLRDIEIVETELLLSDLDIVQRRLEATVRRARVDPTVKRAEKVLQHVLEVLDQGRPASSISWRNKNEGEIMSEIPLLTSKPMLVVCNVQDTDIGGNDHSRRVQAYLKERHIPSIVISAKIEEEVANLDDTEAQQAFLEEFALGEIGLGRIVRSCYQLLDLITFYTVGPDESRAWKIKRGTKAAQAAGNIHSDMEYGFICAETLTYENIVACGGEEVAKAKGYVRTEGREYEVQDGDVLHFRFRG